MAIDTFGREILTTFDNGGMKAVDRLEVDGDAFVTGDLAVDGSATFGSFSTSDLTVDTLDVSTSATIQNLITNGILTSNGGISNIGNITATGTMSALDLVATNSLTVDGRLTEAVPRNEVRYVTSAADMADLLVGDTYVTGLIEIRIQGNVDIGANKIELTAGARLRFSTAAISTVTSSNASYTIQTQTGAGICSITGGGFIINSGGGSAIDMQSGSGLFITGMLCSSPTGIAITAESPSLLAGNTLTATSSVDGIIITGTAGFVNLSQSSVAAVSGTGFQILDATFLNLNSFNGNSTGDCVVIDGDIPTVTLSGTVVSSAGIGTKVRSTGGTTQISAITYNTTGAQGGLDLDTSMILTYETIGGSIISTGMGFGALIADANSANTPAFGGLNFTDTSVFNVAGGSNLAGGVTKKDERVRFFNCVGVLNSVILGGICASAINQLAVDATPAQVVGTYTLDSFSERLSMPVSGDLQADARATRLYRVELLLKGAKSAGSSVTFQFLVTRSQDGGSTFPITELEVDFTTDNKGGEVYGFTYVEVDPDDRFNIEIQTAAGEGNATYIGEACLIATAAD